MSRPLQIRTIVVEDEASLEDRVSLLLALAPWRVPMEAIVNGPCAPAPVSPPPVSPAERRASARLNAAAEAADRIDRIIALVAAAFDVERARIIGPSRSSVLVPVRAAIAWLARYVGGYSSTQVASRMGPRDHSSILSNSKTAFELRESDLVFKVLTDRLAANVREIAS